MISCLEQGADELSAAVKASVLAKLKTLCDDWSQTETDIKRLLDELTQCEIFSRYFNRKMTFLIFLDLNEKDSKNASAVQRKIVMKGCNKTWVIAIRQIVSNLEANQAKEAETVVQDPLDVTPANVPTSDQNWI